MEPKITIHCVCHNFQRRFGWMLASLAQQTRPDLVTVHVAHRPGNGNPTTEELSSKYPFVRRFEWTDDSFQYRGIVRNQAIAECKTEWLWFGDCDLVFHPEYFERLAAELENHPRARYMLSCGRMSNPKDEATALVNAHPEPSNAWALADRLTKREMRNIGAGFCQLINHRHAPHGGCYTPEGVNRDWGFEKGWNTKSDMLFRKRIGSRKNLPRWFTEHVIHLNHNRDPEAGCHITEQR